MVPLLTGGQPPRREFLYWEQNLWDAKARELRADRLMQAARMGEWKAVRAKPGAPLELYNLRQDPGETTNLAPQNPRVVARLDEYLKNARTPPRPHRLGRMLFAT
jgi:arylsulfatase A-like enzyme